MSNYPDDFNGAAFDRRYGESSERAQDIEHWLTEELENCVAACAAIIGQWINKCPEGFSSTGPMRSDGSLVKYDAFTQEGAEYDLEDTIKGIAAGYVYSCENQYDDETNGGSPEVWKSAIARKKMAEMFRKARESCNVAVRLERLVTNKPVVAQQLMDQISRQNITASLSEGL